MASGEAKSKGDDAIVGKADLDLATVCNPGKFEPVQNIKLLGKDKKESARNPSLVVKVKAEWLKVDGKKVVAYVVVNRMFDTLFSSLFYTAKATRIKRRKVVVMI